MRGIVGYGVHVPFWRLSAKVVGGALGSAVDRTTRSVAGYDEDTTSMGVEAARRALHASPAGYSPDSMWFATAQPTYLDKTNASIAHAALALGRTVPAIDSLGSVRSGLGAAKSALLTGGMVILSDMRTGRPASSDETSGGDGACAFTFGQDEPVIAENLAWSDTTGTFMDRWRVPGETFSRQWEDRFGEFAYQDHVDQVLEGCLAQAGITEKSVDHLVVAGLHPRAVAASARLVAGRVEAVPNDVAAEIGNTGVPHWGLLLADALDRSEPGETIAVVVLADGAHMSLWRTTERIATMDRPRSVRSLIADGTGQPSYAQFLSWRGFLEREPARRPEPDRPAAPPSLRSSAWKYGLWASRDSSGRIYLPASRVSLEGGAVDEMTRVHMADIPATIATYTIDRLAYSPSPPLVSVVIDFDGGGRFQCELTDANPDDVAIGDRVQMTFRRLYTSADGTANYFWKARPDFSANQRAVKGSTR